MADMTSRQQRAQQQILGAMATVKTVAALVTDPQAAQALRDRQDYIKRAIRAAQRTGSPEA